MVGYLTASLADKRPSGRRRDPDATRHLRQHLAGMDLHQLTPAIVRRYVDQRRTEVSAATVNRELCVLSSAINYARRDWEWNIPNAVHGRKLRESEGEGRVRWITRQAAACLLTEAAREPQAGHLPDFIRLALHTGCRKGELLGLQWERVDPPAGLIHLETDHTKTRRRRSVPMNADARAAILSRARFRARHCREGEWVFCHQDGRRIGDVKRSFAKVRERAGIRGFRVHDLRHACAAWLVSAGADLCEVRELLGHTTVTITERYGHLAPDGVRAAVALLQRDESRSSHAGRLTVVGGTG